MLFRSAITTIASLNRDVATGRDTSNAIANNLDVAEIQAGFAVTQAFTQQANTVIATQAAKADQAKTALKAEQEKPKDQQDPAKIAALTQQVDDTAQWAPGGSYRQILTAVTAAAGGNVTGGAGQLIQGAAVNYLQSLGAAEVKKIADSLGSDTARAGLHGILACAGASAQGGDCGSAAMGASAGVVINTLLAGDTNTMTAIEKENRKNIVATLVAGIAAGTGASSSGIVAATNAAVIETENNAMLAVKHVRDPKLANVCAGESQGVCGLANRVNQNGVQVRIQDMPKKDKWYIRQSSNGLLLGGGSGVSGGIKWGSGAMIPILPSYQILRQNGLAP